MAVRAPEPKETRTFRLPSGGVVDIDRPDFALCKTVEDFLELKYALSEKIIDIESQIEMHAAATMAGKPVSLTGEPVPYDWLPRANAALKWAKLARDECQNRQGRMSAVEKQKRHLETERAVVDIVKGLLPPDKFMALIEVAEMLAQYRIGKDSITTGSPAKERA